MSSISTTPQLERMIRQAGYIEVRHDGGSHHHYRHKVTGAKLTVAFRRGQRMAPTTVKQIAQQVAAGMALQAGHSLPRQSRKDRTRRAS